MNEAVVDKVQTLCRERNRESVLNVFQNNPEHFSCIPLNDSNVESKQAINDLLRENVSAGCCGTCFTPVFERKQLCFVEFRRLAALYTLRVLALWPPNTRNNDFEPLCLPPRESPQKPAYHW